VDVGIGLTVDQEPGKLPLFREAASNGAAQPQEIATAISTGSVSRRSSPGQESTQRGKWTFSEIMAPLAILNDSLLWVVWDGQAGA
jgi:hypothetical protein